MPFHIFLQTIRERGFSHVTLVWIYTWHFMQKLQTTLLFILTAPIRWCIYILITRRWNTESRVSLQMSSRCLYNISLHQFRLLLYCRTIIRVCNIKQSSIYCHNIIIQIASVWKFALGQFKMIAGLVYVQMSNHLVMLPSATDK